jgi:protein-disulfide isomerase
MAKFEFVLTRRGDFMAKKKATKSKRQVIREQRIQRQRRNRILTILAIVAVAIIVVGLLVYPSIQAATAPVGEIISITPEPRPMAAGTAMGDPDAPVLIEIWEDFQCPACRDYSQNTEPLIAENYVATGDVYYVFRQYPFLDDRVPGTESKQAANASMCAAEQERFWDYHDMLFANWDGENRGTFSDKRLVAFAEAINLDMDSFNSCFEANLYRADIDQDRADGTAVGVTGTPSVFVAGQQLTPGFVPSYQQVSDAVEAALAASGN